MSVYAQVPLRKACGLAERWQASSTRPHAKCKKSDGQIYPSSIDDDIIHASAREVPGFQLRFNRTCSKCQGRNQKWNATFDRKNCSALQKFADTGSGGTRVYSTCF